MITSSLLFFCVDRDALPTIRREGLVSENEIQARLDDALKRCTDCILAIDAREMESKEAGAVLAADHIRNLTPYRPPFAVTAAGGFVLRYKNADPELLLIFRRGIWDLPKGKLDKGESIEECARREVCEELGIDDVRIEAPLGQTVHGYVDGDRYAVKTTHWFTMTTDAESFTPELREKIERVEWVTLPEAKARLGFKTLRRHLAAVQESVIRSAQASGR